MMRWMCKVKLEKCISSDALLQRLGLYSIADIMRRNRLRWYGHAQRSSGWINEITKYNIEGSVSKGRPLKNWNEAVRNDKKA